MRFRHHAGPWLAAISLSLTACGSDDMAGSAAGMDAGGGAPLDPDTAPKVMIDRFSAEAGHLQVRTADDGLPAAGAPVAFDTGPFITEGLGPSGEAVKYYNFDVQPTAPAPIYVLFEEGSSDPVVGQLNVVDVVPGDGGYSDFWLVTKVTVPRGYVANTITSLSRIRELDLPEEPTDMLVNCPVVPDGSTAMLRLNGGGTDLHRGWYHDQVVYYFDFVEKELHTDDAGMVPLSPIYVTFNENPPAGGPPSGFEVEAGTMQTHNVVATLPSDTGYSPLWDVNVYDNAAFDATMDLASVGPVLAKDVATVNCPIVSVK